MIRREQVILTALGSQSTSGLNSSPLKCASRGMMGHHRKLETMARSKLSRGVSWLATLGLCGSAESATPPVISLPNHDVSFYQYSFEKDSRFVNTTCGFLIHGNSLSWEIPRPEWVINLYEVMDSGKVAARVDVATFRVLSDDAKAQVETRPPVTAISFTVGGQSVPVEARIVGRPKPFSGEVSATLEMASAQQVFDALYRADPVTIALAYQGGAQETLEVHKWWASQLFDPPTGKSFPAEGNFVQQCLQALEPAPAAGTQFVIYQLGPIPITNEGGFHPKAHKPGPIGWWSPPGAYCYGASGTTARCGAR